MANTNPMQTLNGILLVEGTQVMFAGHNRGSVYNGRPGTVSKIYPEENLVMVNWERIPGSLDQTVISLVSADELLSNELIAYDGSKLIVGSVVRFRGREDSDIPRGRIGRVYEILPESNMISVRWETGPILRSNPSANDVVSAVR